MTIDNKNKLKFMGMPEFVTGIILWCLVGMIVFTTRDMEFFEAAGTPGPRFLPILIAIVLSVLTILYWITSYKKRGKGVSFPSLQNLKQPAAFCGIALLIVILWDIIGAIPVVFIASLLEFKILEEFSWKRSLIVAAILSVGTFILFDLVFGIILPWGIFR
jgi:hypothetical protein